MITSVQILKKVVKHQKYTSKVIDNNKKSFKEEWDRWGKPKVVKKG